jgi:hypothetical protein
MPGTTCLWRESFSEVVLSSLATSGEFCRRDDLLSVDLSGPRGQAALTSAPAGLIKAKSWAKIVSAAS